MKSHDIHLRQTAKFVTYVLGRHPDEFGLVPDPQGYVSIKSLLKAVHEEQGWRHLRIGHLNELVLNLDPPPIELQGGQVRATSRDALPLIAKPDTLPKLLYTAVRQRAYPVVLDKGIRPSQGPDVILSSSLQMAERMGKRIDNHPVVLTVHVSAEPLRRTEFRRYGRDLYLTEHIPAGGFSGPPLPREKSKEIKKQKTTVESPPPSPGSFYLDPEKIQPLPTPAEKGKRASHKKSWQTERRKARRHKQLDR